MCDLWYLRLAWPERNLLLAPISCSSKEFDLSSRADHAEVAEASEEAAEAVTGNEIDLQSMGCDHIDMH